MKYTKTKWNQIAANGAYRVINLSLYNHIKDLHATIMVEELIDMYFYLHTKKRVDDYFYYTDEDMAGKILVSPAKVGNLRNILIYNNYVEYKRRGIPCRGWYKINFEQIERDIRTNVCLSKAKNTHEPVRTKETNQFPQNDLTGSSILVEPDGSMGGSYIEKEIIENEKIENEVITNEIINKENTVIEADTSNIIKYDDERLVEIFNIMYEYYPRVFNKEYCLNIFMNIPEIHEKMDYILDRFQLQCDDLNILENNKDHIPTFSSYLRSNLWKVSVDTLINYCKN